MVINKQNLDLVFNALSDATRRAMLTRLAEGEANISTLSAPFKISQPAISKHMRVLEKAGLIERHKNGREHFISIAPKRAKEAQNWIGFYTKHWEARFDALDAYLKEHDLENHKN